MHVCTGEGLPPPDWEELSVPDRVQSQHFAAVHGDHADELELLCRLLDIPVVADR